MSDRVERPLRIAIVGVGKIARDQHIPALMHSPRYELVASASLAGEIAGLPSYRSIDQLLAAGHDLDAVSICTPPKGRKAIVRAAIAAGLAVMIEKPPAATLSEVAEFEALAAGAGTVLFAAWHSREAAGVVAARDWLRGRRIDRVAIDWREDIRRWHPGQDWILAAGGFGVFDPGINALSIATCILPDPLIVESADFFVPAGSESPLAASLRMRCGAIPVIAAFDFLKQGPQQWDIVVETDAGPLALRQGGAILEIDGKRSEGPDEEYARLYDNFADLIRDRRSDVDVAPLRLVADAFLIARRTEIEPFAW